MKVAGTVTAREIKDYGKGKDAEPKLVHFATVRVDGRSGLPSGRFTFALTDEEVANRDYDLGEQATLTVEQPQQRLDLNQRAAARRGSTTH